MARRFLYHAPQPLFSDKLPYPISKSHAAFLFSAQRLFAIHAKVYFWTWTFKTAKCDWQYPYLYDKIMTELRGQFHGSENGGLQGLRVLEHHETHGLHYHLLLNERVPVALLKRIGLKYGLGRISVMRCNPDTAWYLAKYLTKGDEPFYRGGGITTHTKRWHCVGGFQGCRKSDVEMDCWPVRVMKEFCFRVGQLPFRVSRVVYNYGSSFGSVRSWDFKTKRRFLQDIAPLIKLEEQSQYLKIVNWVNQDRKFGELDIVNESNEYVRKTKEYALERSLSFPPIIPESRKFPKLHYVRNRLTMAGDVV